MKQRVKESRKNITMIVPNKNGNHYKWPSLENNKTV